MLIFIYLFLVGPITMQAIGGFTQDVYWRNYIHGDVPRDAYEGAPGKYIGQVNAKGFDIVANIYIDSGKAITTYGDKIIVEKDIRILCSPDHSRLYWDYIDLNQTHGDQLQHAVKGGFQHAEHYQLYIGKAIHEGEWRIGKVIGYEPSHVTGLWVWGQDEKHFNFQQFFILKYNVTDVCEAKC